MTEFNFYLSEEDIYRLFYLKQKAGLDDLTGNEYAKKILHRYLYDNCPKVPERDEEGNWIFDSTL